MDKVRILCIDDDINMLNNEEEVLLSAGYEVSLAKSGIQGIKMLNRGIKFNLILLDVDMPEMDGYETMRRVRMIPGCEGTPVIFLTGMDTPDFEVKGLECGASDYITKPFIRSVFLARIKNRISVGEASGRTEYDPEAMNMIKDILSPSELSVAKYVSEGLSNREIADKMYLSYPYVKKIVSNIMSKLNYTNRSEIRTLLRPDEK